MNSTFVENTTILLWIERIYGSKRFCYDNGRRGNDLETKEDMTMLTNFEIKPEQGDTMAPEGAKKSEKSSWKKLKKLEKRLKKCKKRLKNVKKWEKHSKKLHFYFSR